jgi:iron complex outermembrane receptor protein
MKKTLFSLLAMTSAAVMAVEQPADSLKTVELQGIQVTSTRATKKTPVAFSDMNRDAIKQVNHGQDIPYLLSLTPSVTVTSDAGNGIGYTTLRVRGTAAERINITTNGVPMNDAESNNVFWVNMGDFASSVQSMQIQRGVGTSTNGAGAFGATINMQTENIGIRPYAGIDLSGGSYYSNKETVRFSTGLPDGGHWGLQGRLSHIGSKGYIDRAETQLYSYFLQYGYFDDRRAVKFITWNGEEKTYHAWDYSSHYAQDTYGRTYNPCGYMGDDEQGRPLYYSDQTDNYHQQNYQLVWNERFSQALSLNAALHYTRGDGHYEQFKGNAKLNGYLPLTAAETGMRSDLVRQKKMGNDFYGLVASLNYDNRQGLEATVGGGWNKYDGDHFGRITWMKETPAAYTHNYNYYKDHAKKTDANIYGKVNYELLKGLSAFVDLQYRHVGMKMEDPSDWFVADKPQGYVIDRKYDFFNPKAGLNYQFLNRHRLYASYAIAHKEPVRNNFQNNYNAGMEQPRSERLNDIEAGYRFASPRFTAGLNFYHMDYKDQFVLTGEIDAIGEAITRNLDKSYRLGLELEAAWMPVDWLRWDVNATWSKNRVKDIAVQLEDGSTETLSGEKHLAFSPDFLANTMLTLSHKGFKAQLQGQYVGDQYLTNTGFKDMLCQDDNGNDTYETLLLKSHFLANLDLSYTFFLKALALKEATVGVTLYNLFSAKFDNNGWAAPQYRKLADGSVIAVNTWGVRDDQAVGFAPSAPFNFMAHLSLTF